MLLLLDRLYVQLVILLLVRLFFLLLYGSSDRFGTHLGLAIKISAFLLRCQPVLRYRLGTGLRRLDIELRVVCHGLHPRLKLADTTLQRHTLLFELGDHILQQVLFLPDESFQVLIPALQALYFCCGCHELGLDCQHLYAVVRVEVLVLPAIIRG